MTVLRTEKAAISRRLQRQIAGQMKELPLDGLLALRAFAISLREHSLEKPFKPSEHGHCPTVAMPADSLLGMVGIVPPIGGDALADTEALYDQV